MICSQRVAGLVRSIVFLAVGVLVFRPLPLAAVEEEHPQDGPTAVIQQLHDVYGGVLKESAELGYKGRYERLSPAVTKAFDSAFMARAIVGRYWNKLTEEQQNRWVEAFREFTAANYAARLDHDSGQKFEILGEKAGKDGTVIVFSHVVDPGSETIDLNYRLRKTPEGWQIIDVYAKGTVSELALRRSEYASVLKREGFEKLIETIHTRIAELESGATTKEGKAGEG